MTETLMNRLRWGLQMPSFAVRKWGARAIYLVHPAPYVDLVHDRIDWQPEGDTGGDLKTWLNDVALPWLRQHVKDTWLENSSQDTVATISADRRMILRASPRGSYGYLYIGAAELRYPLPPAGAPADFNNGEFDCYKCGSVLPGLTFVEDGRAICAECRTRAAEQAARIQAAKDAEAARPHNQPHRFVGPLRGRTCHFCFANRKDPRHV